MLMMPDVSLDHCCAHAGNVDIPPIDEVAFRQCIKHAGVNGISVDDFHFGESYSLLEAGSRGDA